MSALAPRTEDGRTIVMDVCGGERGDGERMTGRRAAFIRKGGWANSDWGRLLADFDYQSIGASGIGVGVPRFGLPFVRESLTLVSQPAAIEGGGFRGMRKAVAPSEESEAEIRVGGKKSEQNACSAPPYSVWCSS